jgi:hypothetical protein
MLLFSRVKVVRLAGISLSDKIRKIKNSRKTGFVPFGCLACAARFDAPARLPRQARIRSSHRFHA